MQNTTIVRPLPDIEEEVATRLGDEILLGSVKTETVKRVKGNPKAHMSRGSHQPRAWVRGGNVD